MNDWKEQTAFERAQWEVKRARIVKVAREEPDLRVECLVERFGEPRTTIQRVLSEENLPREKDWFDAYMRGRRTA